MEMVKVPVFVSARLRGDGVTTLHPSDWKLHGSGFHFIYEGVLEIPKELIPDMRLIEAERLREEIKTKRATCEVECINLERRIASLLCLEMEDTNERSPS